MIEATIKKDITENPVLLFMKGNAMAPQCGFSAQVVQILTNLKLPELQNEVNRLKELISNTNDNKKQTDLIIKYNKILHEIKIIKNKELE